MKARGQSKAIAVDLLDKEIEAITLQRLHGELTQHQQLNISKLMTVNFIIQRKRKDFRFIEQVDIKGTGTTSTQEGHTHTHHRPHRTAGEEVLLTTDRHKERSLLVQRSEERRVGKEC